MQSKTAKRAAVWAVALFALALCLHTTLELTHHHVHAGYEEDCTVCQHLQATGKAVSGALRASSAVPFLLALLQAGLFVLVAFAMLRETPTALKVKMNN